MFHELWCCPVIETLNSELGISTGFLGV